MSETLQEWLERTASNPRVMACGVRQADRSILARSCRNDLAESRVQQAMRQISEGVFALQQSRMAADQLRWTFEGGAVRCAMRPGGVLAFLVVNRDSADMPEVEQLLADFALASG